MTYHEFLNVLKQAKVSQNDFFRVHGRSAQSARATWRVKKCVPAWVERQVMALIEVPGYREYIMDQDLESLKIRTHRRTPVWLWGEKAKDE